jgi:chromosome segregation ATPase
MSNQTAAALQEIEAKMAELKAVIDGVDARLVPVDAEIDALLEEQQKLQRAIDIAAEKLAAARGMPPAEYLELKRKYGRLAATRMQLRQTAKDL